MGLIKKSIGTISGLPEKLTALDNTDAAQTLAFNTHVTDVFNPAKALLDIVNANEATAGSFRKAAKDVQDNLNAHVTGDFTTLKNLVDVVNGSDTTVGSFRKAIADVIDTSPDALNTLKEIANYINVNPDATVADAITRHVTEAVNSLKGTVSTTNDTLAELETHLSDEVTNRTQALADFDVAIKAFIANSVRTGGAVDEMELLTVVNGKVTLSYAPKFGVKSIDNYGRASYVDPLDNEVLAPLSLDPSDATGRTFILSTDTTGELNGKSVYVQYRYVAA